MKRIALALSLLLALAVALPVSAQTTPTPTYTPVPTRTPYASTQVVTTILMASSSPMQVSRSMSFGDVAIVLAVAAVGMMFAISQAYEWVKGHIRVSE